MRSSTIYNLLAGVFLLSSAAAQGPLDALLGSTYGGCVAINFDAFTFDSVTVNAPNSPQICQAACRTAGYLFAYVQGDDCACSDTRAPVAFLYPDVGFGDCFFQCTDITRPDARCGGISLSTFVAIYNVFELGPLSSTTSTVTNTATTFLSTSANTGPVTNPGSVTSTVPSTTSVVTSTSQSVSSSISTVRSSSSTFLTTANGPRPTFTNGTLPQFISTVYSTSTYTITACPPNAGKCHPGQVTTTCIPVGTAHYPGKKHVYEDCSTYVTTIDDVETTCTDTYTRTKWYDDQKTYVKTQDGHKTLVPIEPTETGYKKHMPTHVVVSGEPSVRDPGFLPLMAALGGISVGMLMLL